MMSNLIFIGPPASGKTTYGRALAELLNRPFYDTDALLEEQSGMSCRELYHTLGNEAFRKLELTLLEGLLGVLGAVIAVGGGAPTYPPSYACIQRLGFRIYLKASPELIKERVASRPPAAYLKGTTLDALLEEREPLYAALANLTLYDAFTHSTLDP